ncbi:MAG: hypothetical protein CL928_09055, partial [Deltaproteobacteria bacterium]|nr:hypothetical protein [Deltaproteobacteria bacterium]
DDDTGDDDTGDDDSADDDDSGDDDDSSNDDDDAGSTGLGDPPRTVAENSSEFGCDCSQAPRDSVNSQPMGSRAILLALLLALTPAWLQRRRL